jgi:hypothetical protein
MTWSGSPEQIAGRLIRRSRWTRPHGQQAARSAGGLKNVSNGWAGYAVQTAVNDGLGLLIFVLRAAHSHNSNLSPVFDCELEKPTTQRRITRHRS